MIAEKRFFSSFLFFSTKKWRMYILAHVTQPKHVLESCL